MNNAILFPWKKFLFLQYEVLIPAQDSILTDHVAEDEDHGYESEPSEWSFASLSNEQESQTTDRDIMMVVLLSLSIILCLHSIICF